MENIYLFVAILILLEIFELYIQKSDTLLGVMQKLFFWYKKSIFAFFLVHPSFYFLFFVILYTDTLNIYMILMLVFKIFDLFYKMELIKSIFIKQRVSLEIESMLEWQIPSWFFLLGLSLYPPLLFYALSF
jgi:hypothetical protein